MKLFSHKKRPVDLGPYPLERLPRASDPQVGRTKTQSARPTAEARGEGANCASAAYKLYVDMYNEQRHGEPAEAAPVPDDPKARAEHIKAGLYFLDADMVGCGVVPDEAWLGDSDLNHRHGVAILVAFSRDHGADKPGSDWIDGTRQVNAELRAAELAVITAGYIRRLGFAATAHTPTATDVDLVDVAKRCGLVESKGSKLTAPFLKTGFALSVVSTDFEMAVDGPLAPRSFLQSLRSTKSLGWLIGKESKSLLMS